MKFIDTHIHLQDYNIKYTTDIIETAQAKGVEKFICVGTSPEDWEKVAAQAERRPEKVIPAFGLHPWHTAKAPENWAEILEAYLQKYPGALVGECGLDGYKNQSPEPQNAIFQKQLNLAAQYNRPVLIHAVKCQDDLEKYWKKLPPRCVFHSYNGKREVLKKILASGAYVSFSFSVLQNRDCEELVKMVPDDKILIETDGPYQSPVPHTETLPEQLPELALILASLREESECRFAEQTYRNSERLINGRDR